MRRSSPHHQTLLIGRAASMRAAPTTTESLLWAELFFSKLGVGFRRQVPLGRYIADFLAPSDKLIIEVDGGYHAGREQADARRDRQLGKLGYRVLHLPGQLVQGNMAGAIALVRAALGY